MLIVCDKDTEPPDVPEIKTYEDFSKFIHEDSGRLFKYGASYARYFEDPWGAALVATPLGYFIEVYTIEINEDFEI
jgi:hypothetical protein